MGLSEAQAFGIVGAYGGGVYLMQPAGAWIADRLLAVRYVVAISGFLIMAGHVALFIVPELTGLLIGLVLITLGTGGLFPNVLAMVGQLYENTPEKRDSGFSLYYTGIMLGALIGPLVTGFLQVRANFHVAFSAAAVGMAIGLAGYVLGWKTLPASAASVPNPLSTKGKFIALLVVALTVIIGVVVANTSLITLDNGNSVVLALIGLVSVAYFVVMLRAKSVSKAERQKVLAYIPLYVASIWFWMMVLQLFTTFAVYAETRVDLSVVGFEMPAAYISTFEVVAGIVAGPLIAMGWQKMGAKQPSTAAKMAIGLLVMAVAYGTFAGVSALYGSGVSLLPVIGGMVLFGIAEVTFAPIAFSAATQLAPQMFYSQMVALSGLAIGAGASLSGFVGQMYDASHESIFFVVVALSVFLVSIAIFCLRPWLRRCGL